jgi:serpin B
MTAWIVAYPQGRATGEKPAEVRLAAADNEFGFNLFGQLVRQDRDRNVFFSPLSVAFALAMTYNGAAGETRQAMEQVLRLNGMNHAELDDASAALMNGLKSADPQIALDIANSLWARQGIRFNEAFLARNRKFFGAEVSTLDFASPGAKDTINAWVSRNTAGKIPAIIDRIEPRELMILVNAIYFKGQWQKPFDKTRTKAEQFHVTAATQKSVPLMSQSGDYPYFRGDNFQAISLPYGQGGTSLYLFLPDEKSSLDNLLKDLSLAKWEQWLKSFHRTPGDIKIPRFKLDYGRSLNEPLKALGMGVAFDPGRADFSGIRAERDLAISDVEHKAMVDVNEEGTEAAAATSVGMVAAAMPMQRFTFIADRPFLMLICDRDSGAILFIGKVVDPK